MKAVVLLSLSSRKHGNYRQAVVNSRRRAAGGRLVWTRSRIRRVDMTVPVWGETNRGGTQRDLPYMVTE